MIKPQRRTDSKRGRHQSRRRFLRRLGVEPLENRIVLAANWLLTGDANVDEGSAANYTVSLNGGLGAGESASVDITLTDADTTASDHADLTAAVSAAVAAYAGPGAVAFDGVDTVTFTAALEGDSMADLPIALTAEADGLVEADEGYTIALANPVSSGGDVSIGLPPTVAPESLVAHYEADGNAVDATGLNNGSLNNGVGFAPGVFGQAFDFNGVNTYVSAPDSPSLDLTTAMTISMWVAPRSPGEGAGHTGLLFKGNDIDSPIGQSYGFIHTTNNSIAVRSWTSASSNFQVFGPALPLGEFTHLTATYDGTASFAKFYVNGVEVGSTTNVTSILPNTNYPLLIGANGDHGAPQVPPPWFAPYTRVYDGLMDDVRIYNAALDASQVAALSGVQGASVTTTIASNDIGTWSLSGDATVAEGAAAAYAISLSNALGSGQTTNIDVALSDADTTSSDHADFAAAVSSAVAAYAGDGALAFDGVDTITFTAGADGDAMADLAINLAATDDSLVEGDEDYNVALANPGGSSGDAAGGGSLTTTIQDGDALTVEFDRAASSDLEASGGNLPLVLVTGEVQAGHSVNVNVDVTGGSATAADFTAPTALTINGGAYVAQAFAIPGLSITDDEEEEPDETLTLGASGGQVTVGDANGDAITQGATTYTILNDDVQPNEPPEIISASTDATLTDKALPNEMVTLTAIFTDPNTGDSHTASIDWGDGTVTSGVVDQDTGTVTGTHAYATGGLFTVTVTVTDAEGESDVETATAVVTGVRLTGDGQLQVIGSEGRDKIHVSKFWSRIRVHAKLGGRWLWDAFHKSDVESILVFGCGGDDHIHISRRIQQPATIDAGEGRDYVSGGGGEDLIRGGTGNDHLSGGPGDDIVLGESGNDWIVGGFGRDILIGGAGRDWIAGGFGDDILIGGTTDHDANDNNLRAIMAEWRSNEPFAARVTNIRSGGGANGAYLFNASTVHADGELDHLLGVLGKDWLWAESVDRTLADFNALVEIDDT